MLKFSEYLVCINESELKKSEQAKTELKSKIKNSKGDEKQKLLARMIVIDDRIRSLLN